MAPKSIGCVVVREGRFLLVHPSGWYNRRRPHSIPKGMAAPGEGEEETAVREVREETGIGCRIVADLGTVRQKGGKEVRAFLAEAAGGRILPDGSCPDHDWEVDEARFFPPEEALEKIIETQRPLLEKALAHLAGKARN